MAAPIKVSDDQRAFIDYDGVRGDTFISPPVTFATDGVQDDFSTWTLVTKIFKRNELILTLTVGSGITVVGGVLVYTIPYADTDVMLGDYEYDTQKTSGAIRKTIQSGTLTIKPDRR